MRIPQRQLNCVVHWMCYTDNESQQMYTNLSGLSCYQVIALLIRKTTFYDDVLNGETRKDNNSSLYDFILLMTLISELQSLWNHHSLLSFSFPLTPSLAFISIIHSFISVSYCLRIVFTDWMRGLVRKVFRFLYSETMRMNEERSTMNCKLSSVGI